MDAGGLPLATLYRHGHTESVDADQLRRSLSGEELVWAHVQAGERQAAYNFILSLGFHPLAVEDSLSDAERPEIQRFPGYLFLATAETACGEDEDTYLEVAFFVGKHYVVVVTKGPCRAVEVVAESWARRPEDLGRSSGHFLYHILDEIVDEYFPAADALEDQVDRLEEAIYSGKTITITHALKLKRRLLRMRRHITAIRDVQNALLKLDSEIIGPECKPYFQDLYDHALRIAENIDLNRDILATILDAQLNIVSNNLNQVMKVMTALATILMSVGLIAGIYGMNFRVMPELAWHWGYPFAIGLMAFVAALEYVIFRRLKWI
ncbi:MAG TPA: magnesium/cobalt transporter CorA [Fimbriimonadaceae bacterium]|nr:magnesium/cobalt transporter CorA [Fimbriimonadaceae bacterium]